MRIIVTGGAGFIGSAVCRLLVGEFNATVLNVENVDSLPIDPKALAWLLRRLSAERNVTVVVATAAKR